MAVKHIKWHFNVAKWAPRRDEWLKLTAAIGADELERINKFVYAEDAKASLVGQSLIRQFLVRATGRPPGEPRLVRGQHGRPELAADYRAQLAGNPQWLDFNVSHSGDFCVLAGAWTGPGSEPGTQLLSVGVDVTKIVSKRSPAELARFLELMSRREFLPAEWETVRLAPDERQRCVNFTRLWCLKESYIKALGLGLAFRLDRICFRPSADTRLQLSPAAIRGRLLASTQVELDGRLEHDWRFHETSLDDQHLVAVAYRRPAAQPALDWRQLEEAPFVELAPQELLAGLEPSDASHERHWTHFRSRPSKAER